MLRRAIRRQIIRRVGLLGIAGPLGLRDFLLLLRPDRLPVKCRVAPANGLCLVVRRLGNVDVSLGSGLSLSNRRCRILRNLLCRRYLRHRWNASAARGSLLSRRMLAQRRWRERHERTMRLIVESLLGYRTLRSWMYLIGSSLLVTGCVYVLSKGNISLIPISLILVDIRLNGLGRFTWCRC